MNIIDFMESKKLSFTKTDSKIYDNILKNHDTFSNASISDISSHFNISKSALTRFSQKMGFSGYNEFQFFLKQNALTTKKDNRTSLAHSISDLLIYTENQVSDEMLQTFISTLSKARITYILGYSVTRLASDGLGMILNFVANILAATPNLDNLPDHHTSDDVVIIYSSLSGDVYKNYISNLSDDPNQRPFLILITTNPKHPLRHYFNDIIVLPSISPTNEHFLTHELFTYLFFNQLLVQKLKTT